MSTPTYYRNSNAAADGRAPGKGGPSAFHERELRDDDAVVLKTAVDLPRAPLGRWPVEPNESQLIRGGNEALRRAMARGDSDYDPAADQQKFAYRLADQESCYEAFRHGETDHPDNAAYQAIWDGAARGQSKAMTSARLDELTSLCAGVKAGTIHPRAIITYGPVTGSAADRDMAVMIAGAHIATLTEAMACGGRNLSTNQISVCQNRVDTPF